MKAPVLLSDATLAVACPGYSMKVSDFIFPFPVAGCLTTHGICRVRLFALPNTVVVLLTDLGGKNPGYPVTHGVEEIRDALVRRGFITTNALIVQHYEPGFWRSAMFDHVTFSAEGHAQWRSMSLEEAQVFIGCSADELKDSALENDRLLTEIEQIRHAIDPFVDFPIPEPASVITRKLEIERGMVPRDAIKSLIDAGAGERAMQQLLKSDLSMFGEMYSDPPGEYVCFAEFPIGRGVVDFAVFSGTSRMDVVLIEVKGADFFLVNGDPYAGFSRKINQAADQIRQRLGHAYRHLEEFRLEVHAVLKAVESGKSLYHSFPGPQEKLQVDPNKDVNIRAVVIGGRTRDDREESRKRHEYEAHFVPPIRIESWDTWFRRLRRP